MGKLDKLYFDGQREIDKGDWDLHFDSIDKVEEFCSTDFYGDDQGCYEMLNDALIEMYIDTKENDKSKIAFSKEIIAANTGEIKELKPILMTGTAFRTSYDDDGNFIFSLMSKDEDKKTTFIQITCKKEFMSRYSIFKHDYIKSLESIDLKRVIVALSHVIPARGLTKEPRYDNLIIANCIDIDISEGKYYDYDNIQGQIEGHHYVYCDEEFKIHQSKDYFKKYNEARTKLANSDTQNKYSKESINRTISSGGCLSVVCTMIIIAAACLLLI